MLIMITATNDTEKKKNYSSWKKEKPVINCSYDCLSGKSKRIAKKAIKSNTTVK